MQILNTVILKIAHVIAAVIVVMGLSTVPQTTPPPQTEIDLPVPTIQQTAPTQTPAPAPVQQSTTQPVATIPIKVTPPATPDQPTPEPTIIYVPVYVVQPPAVQTPTPEPPPVPQPTHMSQAKIEIVSPMSNKGLGRTYLARTEALDEANFVSIGAILYNDDGEVVNADTMTVTTSDPDQNKIIPGTGNIWGGRYVNGEKKPAYYYPYTYNFKTPGDHTITFEANGISKSITINVPSVDTR